VGPFKGEQAASVRKPRARHQNREIRARKTKTARSVVGLGVAGLAGARLFAAAARFQAYTDPRKRRRHQEITDRDQDRQHSTFLKLWPICAPFAPRPQGAHDYKCDAKSEF
jgi:hypothetical protein